MKRIPLMLMMLALSLPFFIPIAGAMVEEITPTKLIQQSESVLLVTVTDSYSAWSDDHSTIYTYVTVDVLEKFTGPSVGKDLLVQIPGGEVGEIGLRASDAPVLIPGMTAIIHTFTQDQTGYPWINGGDRGVLVVDNDFIPAYSMTLSQFRTFVETSSK